METDPHLRVKVWVGVRSAGVADAGWRVHFGCACVRFCSLSHKEPKTDNINAVLRVHPFCHYGYTHNVVGLVS